MNAANGVDPLADFLGYRHIVQMALADLAARCDNASTLLAITANERKARESQAECARLARAAYAALAHVAGAQP